MSVSLSVCMFVCLFHYNEGIYALTIKMKTLAMLVLTIPRIWSSRCVH